MFNERFERMCIKVERLLNEGRLPVIVGGTHYYIESLLWRVLLDSDEDSDGQEGALLYETDRAGSPGTAGNDHDDDDKLLASLTFTQDGLDHVSSSRLHRLLCRVDPDMADALHPNNRRKIIRYILKKKLV